MDTNEQLQILALQDLKTLKSAADDSYEDILYLTSKIYRAPISGAHLKDQNQVRVQTKNGISVDAQVVKSICGDLIKRRWPLYLTDAQQDGRFQRTQIRFFAGVPLFTNEGVAVGALFVMDTSSRRGAEVDMQALEVLARQLVRQWESRRIKKSREKDLQLLHHSKLASLGEMVASITHEINNPLAIINGNVGLLRRTLSKENPGSTKTRQYLDSIENTVRRIDKIIRGLKTLCRGGEREPFERVDLRDCITTAISMVVKNFKSRGIEIRHSYRYLEAIAECRAFQIEQILVNLLSNSFDAIKGLQEQWVEIGISDQGLQWTISVTDSGMGIPVDLRDKIMNPFFTTKEGDQGTGLGLSISKSLAKEHGGNLELDSGHSRTRFVLSLSKSP